MFGSTDIIKMDRAIKAFALLVGIVIGYFYASMINHSYSNQLNFNEYTKFQSEETLISTNSQQFNKMSDKTNKFLVYDDKTVANDLSAKILILCLIHRQQIEENHVDSIMNTWGTRCSKIVFITNNVTNNSTDVVTTPIARDQKTEHEYVEDAYRYIYNEYLDKFDWFLKTNGDTYYVMENLRHMLKSFDATKAIGFGCKLKSTDVKQGYFSDEVGYVLSKNALIQLIDGIQSDEKCKSSADRSSDVRISKCLEEMNVILDTGNDEFHKNRFFNEYFDDFLLPQIKVNFSDPWNGDYVVNTNLNAVSNYSIAFSHIAVHEMYVMELLIYQLRPYNFEQKHDDDSVSGKTFVLRNFKELSFT